MQRRNFLKTAALTLATGVLAPNLLTSCKNIASESKNIGLQLSSLRYPIRTKGIQAILADVAKIGYKNLELGSYGAGKMYGILPKELKKMVGDLGMEVTSSHAAIFYDPNRMPTQTTEWWKQAIEAHNKLGVKYIILPWMPVNRSTTLDEIKESCDYFSRVAMLTAVSGISFGYHNHAFEFNKINDELIYDFILKNVSQDVSFQLNAYFVEQAGYKPVDYMKKYASQIKTLVIRDKREIGESENMDFQSIFEQAKANKITDWYVQVEEYTNNNPEQSVAQSFNFLNDKNYVF